jgi:Tol biopolymer transport system component
MVGPLLAVAAVAEPASPSTFPGANGKIAFEMFASDELDDEIFVVNPDGTGLVDLTNDSADDRDPCWSPDGTRIAFQREEVGADNADIWVMNADGSGQTQRTSEPEDERAPCWSPDGSQLVYEKSVGSSTELWVMQSDGSGQTQVTSGNTDFSPTWSPDGTTIAFTRQLAGGGAFDIWSVPATGGAPTNLTNVASQNDFAPCFSPDGATIAYSQTTPAPGSEIFVMDADGGNQHQVTDDGGAGPNADEACFSPDGTQLVFVYNFQLYVANADGSDPVPLITTEDNAVAPNWQPILTPAPPAPPTPAAPSAPPAPAALVLQPAFTG